MPFTRLRLLLLTLPLFTLLTLTLYATTTFLSPPDSPAGSDPATESSPQSPSLLSAVTTSFFFPPAALISLADDNNTFFVSRPAAFGPSLPKTGLEGDLFVLEPSQLACDDIPGWDPTSPKLELETRGLRSEAEEILELGEEREDIARDDGTDDALHIEQAEKAEELGKERPAHADIETIQQAAEIEGKIVLVQRGGCGFLEKVLWTQRRGGIALIVGDYKRNGLGSGGLVTMFAKGDTSNVTIPSVFTSHTTASLLTSLLPPPPHEDGKQRDSLRIVLTPTTLSSSPFFDTLLVLVISPLVTLTIVYTLLIIRARIRRRRWRAPKSVVERLPVRTYHTIPSPPSSMPQTRRSSSAPEVGRTSMDGAEERGAQEVQWEGTRRGWSGSRECVVCLEEYVDGVSRVMRLPCGHEFHAECITPWLTTRRRTCPICKGDVVRGSKNAAPESARPPTDSSADETTPLVLADDSSDEEDLERR